MDIPPDPVAPRRPASWLVIGIISIVWGGIGVLGTLWGLIAHLVLRQPNPMAATPLLATWFWLSSVISGVASVALVVAGAGLVQNRDGARRLALAWAWLQVVLVPIGTLIALANVDVLLAATTQQMGGASGTNKAEAEAIMRVVLYVSTVIGLFVGLALPVVMLLMLRRRPVLAGGDARSVGDDPTNPYRAPGG